VDRLDGAYAVPAPGPAPDEREAIARLFAAMVRDDQTHDVGPLHDAVCALVIRMRARGAPPEQVIIALKQAIDRVPITHGPPARYARDLAATAVRLCIAEYYRSPGHRAD
jgi:hypothetical protein